jgi:hypothetical protein
MKDMYTLEYYSATMKNEVIIFCGKIDSTGDCHVKWNNPDS